ncbi:MAG: Hint domain-containing protein [Pseudomonadota bacterium]
MAIGEAGTITTNSPTENAPITVTFDTPLTDPVFAFTHTNNGGDPFVIRVTNQTTDINGDTTSFTFIFEEWEYLDGPHSATETISWLAIEKGIHLLPDGRLIEAGTSDVSSAARNTGISETFVAPFSSAPVVLTSVMSDNDSITIDSDPSTVTSSGFNLTLQEEEGQDGVHATETIGWIAIQAGGSASTGTAQNYGGFDENVDVLSLGDTFVNPVVLAETQTINGGDTATVITTGQTTDDVSLFLREETSNDTELGHVNETVGVVAFEDGVIPCFTAGTEVQTPCGPVRIEDLRVGDLVTTADHGDQPIRWIGRRRLSARDLARDPKLRPVRIVAHALGQNLPQRDLWVSRQHRMRVSSKIAERMFGEREALIAAIKLTELPGIYVDDHAAEVDYIHLLFDVHAVVFAEGAAAESLYLGAQTHDALSPEAEAEIATLFPDLRHGSSPAPAHYIPSGKHQKKLVARHAKNAQPLLM